MFIDINGIVVNFKNVTHFRINKFEDDNQKLVDHLEISFNTKQNIYQSVVQIKLSDIDLDDLYQKLGVTQNK